MAAFRAGFAALARSASLASVAGRRVGGGWLVPYSSVRAAHDLPSHLMPGPYPKTPEEMAAAAKKYNLPLADYKPYPDEGMG
ncbi:PREDICTED: NADH dehydrogenase [ubiquinone] 1 beta subcomplex subunit 8, mitochondrial-like [Nanorana parkeri]|uniref:NADH dehydrogenase [ubiquinone] 1 beta subcomplex subunit 8, mitochondrial-like n=1 Tax=Nanorana parkeri TaxID=125878 RepID=UPI0008541CC3|nr:PREDICTED: NADH dehydrogenase [ubiquinone] 1 beta subcomplex subunit 8, mitochondrial-like [Nanorana parkeri]